MEDRTLRSYVGGWPEYVRVRDELRALGPGGGSGTLRPAGAGNGATATAGEGSGGRHAGEGSGGRNAAADGSKGAAGTATKKAAKPKPKGPSKNRLSETQKAERAVEQAEEALAALEQELTDPAAWATQYESAKSEARHTAAKRAVDDAYARLETLID